MIRHLCKIPEPFGVGVVVSFIQRRLRFRLSTSCPSASSFKNFIAIVPSSRFLIAGSLPLKRLLTNKPFRLLPIQLQAYI